MPGFVAPGETYRLSPPWTDMGHQGAASGGWVVHIGADNPTSGTPLGWTTNVISGTIGLNDLVIDVTAPADWVVTNPTKGGTYDVPVLFSHRGGATSWSQYYSFSALELSNPHNPKFDCAAHLAGFYIAAVLEVDGVHFWRMDGAIGDKVEVSNLPGAYPSIWFDDRGVLWGLLSDYSDPRLTDAVPWNLYFSENLGRTWSDPILMPWESPRGQACAKNGAHNSMIAAASLTGGSSAGHFRRSHDGGVSWTDPSNSGVGLGAGSGGPEGFQFYPFQLMNGNIMLPYRFSRNFGRTWNTDSSLFPTPLGHDLNALKTPHTAPAQRSGNTAMWMYVGEVFSTGKLQCGRSNGLGGHTIAKSNIDDADGEWFQIVAIPKTWESSIWKITNGRDRQYKSTDLGVTWTAD